MRKNYTIILFALIIFFVVWLSLLFEPTSFGQPYNSTSLVNTTVNISNSAPNVYNVVLQSPIDLTAYGDATVECNVSVFDYDNNTAGVNATLHQSTSASVGAADQNFRYFNTSCRQITPLDFNTNYSCTFSVKYFANNGTWYCNATAIDVLTGVNSNQSNPATVNPLVAIKMDPILDFGNLGANQISNDSVANVTNAGNRNANISVEGYALTPNDGMAMSCTYGNIPVGSEKYDSINGTIYSSMYSLTGTPTMLRSFYVFQRTSEVTDSINQTFWKIAVPAGAGGVCNGKILFTASDKGN